MAQEKLTFWQHVENVLKIATPLGALIAFLIGLSHYRDTKSEEFKKAYWEKRYDIYENISHTCSALAHADTPHLADSLTQVFYALFNGKAILVEDLHVLEALKSYNQSLKRFSYPDSLQVLTVKSREVSQACRKSLKETWEPISISEIKSLDD